MQPRHAAFFAAFAERAAPELRGADQEYWLNQLDRAYPNMQAAIRFADASDDGLVLLRLVTALADFWIMRTFGAEERGWLDKAVNLEYPEPDALRARAFDAAGRMALRCQDWSSAATFAEAAMRMWRDLADEVREAQSVADLAVSRVQQSERSREPRAYARESARIARQHGEPWTMAYALYAQGQVALGQGKYLSAEAHFEESFRFAGQAGDQLRVAVAMESLAVVESSRKRWDAALRLLAAAAPIRAEQNG